MEFYKDKPKEVTDIVQKIIKKYSKISNTDLVEIWLQRFTDLFYLEEFHYTSEICNFVSKSPDIVFWNSDWLRKELRFIDEWSINENLKDRLDFITPEEEIDAFSETSSNDEKIIDWEFL